MPLGIDYDPTLDTLTITAGGLIQIEILNARQHYPAKFLKTLPTATEYDSAAECCPPRYR